MKQTSVQIGIGIVCEFQSLRIGLRIIFVRWEIFANNSQIPDIYIFSKKMFKNFFFLTPIYFSFEKFTGQTKQ